MFDVVLMHFDVVLIDSSSSSKGSSTLVVRSFLERTVRHGFLSRSIRSKKLLFFFQNFRGMPRLHIYIYIYMRENLKLQGKMSQVQVYDVVKVPSTDYGVAFPYPSPSD